MLQTCLNIIWYYIHKYGVINIGKGCRAIFLKKKILVLIFFLDFSLAILDEKKNMKLRKQAWLEFVWRIW